jgi:hypothetical protein
MKLVVRVRRFSSNPVLAAAAIALLAGCDGAPIRAGVVETITASPGETSPGDAAGDSGAPLGEGSFSWTKPASFDETLEAAIARQPAYMGGYGGQIENPFPQVPGTTKLSAMQITRPDAVVLDDHFGRWSFRFYVDAESKHSNGLRAEFTGGSDFEFRPGDTYRYEFGTYFTADYKNSSWTEWNLFAQFHGPGFGAWGIKTSGGYLSMTPPAAAANEYRIPMPSREEWHDFDWIVHWAHDSSGWAKLYVDGALVFDYRGATMHADEPYYYPKFGSYLANNPYTQVTYSTPWAVTRM